MRERPGYPRRALSTRMAAGKCAARGRQRKNNALGRLPAKGGQKWRCAILRSWASSMTTKSKLHFGSSRSVLPVAKQLCKCCQLAFLQLNTNTIKDGPQDGSLRLGDPCLPAKARYLAISFPISHLPCVHNLFPLS